MLKRISILFVLLIFSLLIFFSCATEKPVTVQAPSFQSDMEKKEFARLEDLYIKKKFKAYLIDSVAYIKRHSSSPMIQFVRYKRGVIYLTNKEYEPASREFKYIIDNYGSGSDVYGYACFYYSIIEYNRHNLDNAIAAIENVKVQDKVTLNEIQIKALWLKSYIQQDQNKYSDVLVTYSQLYNGTQSESVRSKAKISVASMLDKLTLKEVEELSAKFQDGPWAGDLLFELGERYSKLGRNGNAREKFEKLISKFPEHENRTQAEDNLKKLAGLTQVNKYTVGVLLPLSGDNAPFGIKSLRGIQLAAGFFEKDRPNALPIKLSIVDSASDPDITKMGIDKLVAEDHVVSIIGPLRSNTSEVAARQCAADGIPNISLSKKEGLTENRDYIFRVAMTDSNQVKRIVAYAMEQMGIKKFGLMYPTDTYGKEFMRYFWEEVLRRGGELVAIESYEPRQTDFKVEVKKLVGKYYIDARRDEYSKLKSLALADPRTNVRNNQIELPPIEAFDALFIADDAKMGSQIASFLPLLDVDNVTLLGPSTWHNKQFTERGQKHVNGAVFADGYYDNPTTPEGKQFVSRYRALFNSEPGLFEAQAFDAANILFSTMEKVVRNSGDESLNRDRLRDELKKIKNYVGATGEFSFSENGDANKKLFVFGVDKGKIILKD